MPDVSQTANGAETLYDIFIIGGGVNGCGIARDAAEEVFRLGSPR